MALPSKIQNPQSKIVRLLDGHGGLIGMAEPAATQGLLHPSIVLM
jgi:hypothetical protein